MYHISPLGGLLWNPGLFVPYSCRWPMKSQKNPVYRNSGREIDLRGADVPPKIEVLLNVEPQKS